MRTRLLGPTLLLWLATAAVHAQPPAPAGTVDSSGDVWMAAQLADVNRYAGRYPDAFADELVRYYNAPRDLIASLLTQHWTPAEVYYACALASVTGQPCRAVAQAHAAHRDEDWAATAGRLGIASGPVMQQRLRTQLRASYRRWGRPTLPEPPIVAPAKGDGADPGKMPAPVRASNAPTTSPGDRP